MLLESAKKKQLRKAMIAAFDQPALEIFFEDTFYQPLYNVIAINNTFDYQCHQLLGWAIRTSNLIQLLHSFGMHPNAGLRQLAKDLLAASALAAAVPGMTARNFVVQARPILNRTHFWQRLSAIAGGSGSQVLIVHGGVGKSYSVWPMSHFCNPESPVAKFALVRANMGPQIDSTAIARLIATRLWGKVGAGEIDDFAQPSREGKDFCSLLVQRLSLLEENTWLVIDELDLVNLDETAIVLLRDLCDAVDRGECAHLRLFLLGLDPAKLGPRGRFFQTDQVHRPLRKDIRDYLDWFSDSIGKEWTEPLDVIIDQLDALLTTAPDHASWDRFHEKLHQRCSDLAQGEQP